MGLAKPNRARKFDEKGQPKRRMPVHGHGLKRIPGLWRERLEKREKQEKE